MMHESFKFDRKITCNFRYYRKRLVKIHAWDNCDAGVYLSDNHENFDSLGAKEVLGKHQ